MTTNYKTVPGLVHPLDDLSDVEFTGEVLLSGDQVEEMLRRIDAGETVNYDAFLAEHGIEEPRQKAS